MDEKFSEELAEELAETLAKFPEKLVEKRKKGLLRLINHNCAADLLAAKVMTEVIEKIDKDKSEQELISAYRFSIVSINLIEEWEKEKVNRPAQEMEKLKLQTNHQEREKKWEQKRAKFRRWEQEEEIEIEKAKLDMLNMDEDKLQEWEQEKAKVKRQEQEWKIKKAEFKRQEQEWEKENAKIQELEKEKVDLKESNDERILKLKEFKTDLTKFINSRQQGSNLSELTAIGAIGFVLVALMHLGFPEVPEKEFTGYGAFSVHLFTLFTSTIVVFLFFNILDLEKDRHRSLHDVGSSDSDLWKDPVHYNYSSPDKILIFPISAVTATFYVLLLWDKLVKPISFLN